MQAIPGILFYKTKFLKYKLRFYVYVGCFFYIFSYDVMYTILPIPHYVVLLILYLKGTNCLTMILSR